MDDWHTVPWHLFMLMLLSIILGRLLHANLGYTWPLVSLHGVEAFVPKELIAHFI